ncbi:hypothetical protein ACG873_31260 [Mesorhizobium sp. AaZ16]|uniref:hypothetical protein n=1 Tax=Mesorhizobium sp. AaZ16 TaxID=3402289 RepID=UPI00374EE090
MGDDLRRETMALVADGRHCHAAVPMPQMLTQVYVTTPKQVLKRKPAALAARRIDRALQSS